MAESDVELFAVVLMKRVRDRAIQVCDRLVAGEMVGPTAEYWRTQLDGDAREAIEALIPSVVDEVLFEFLSAADSGDLRLAWRQPDGETVPLEDLGVGEMSGWLMGTDGSWRARFSAERFYDPIDGLRLRDPEEPEPSD